MGLGALLRIRPFNVFHSISTIKTVTLNPKNLDIWRDFSDTLSHLLVDGRMTV